MTFASVLALTVGSYATTVLVQTAKPAVTMDYVTVQPSGPWLVHTMFGAPVQNPAGEVIGDINDLVFNPTGQISAVVLGIGGMLGKGEKNVAVPYSALSFKAGPDGARIVVIPLNKDELKLAPIFKPMEKTSYDVMKDKAIALGRSAAESASNLKDQAMKKVEEMKSDTPKKRDPSRLRSARHGTNSGKYACRRRTWLHARRRLVCGTSVAAQSEQCSQSATIAASSMGFSVPTVLLLPTLLL